MDTRPYRLASKLLALLSQRGRADLLSAPLHRIIELTAPCCASPDFASVRWFGTRYSFSPLQSAIVRVLWSAWEHGTPEVRQSVLLESADTDTELRFVFRDHPAWGAMLVPGSAKGTFRLADEKKIEPPVK